MQRLAFRPATDLALAKGEAAAAWRTCSARLSTPGRQQISHKRVWRGEAGYPERLFHLPTGGRLEWEMERDGRANGERAVGLLLSLYDAGRAVHADEAEQERHTEPVTQCWGEPAPGRGHHPLWASEDEV